MEGRTGVPFVDANMRELAATGFMSNRGRHVCMLHVYSLNVVLVQCGDLSGRP